MLRRSIIAVAAVSTIGASSCPTDVLAARRTTNSVVTADSVPSWDVTASCRAAGSISYSQSANERLTSCLASEQRIREELDKNWSTFPAADRISCVKSLTFSPTYTELVTCLEMRRDVKNPSATKPPQTKPRR